MRRETSRQSESAFWARQENKGLSGKLGTNKKGLEQQAKRPDLRSIRRAVWAS